MSKVPHLLAILVFVTGSAAQGAQTELIKVRTERYKEVIKSDFDRKNGLLLRTKLQDGVYLFVWAELEAKWEKDDKQLEISSDDIKLVDDSGKEYKISGALNEVGRTYNGWSSLRPYRDKDPTSRFTAEFFFIVPDALKSVTFKCGPISKKIDIGTPIKEHLGREATPRFGFQVTKVEWVGEITAEFSETRWDSKTHATLKAVSGPMLAVTFAATTLREPANAAKPDYLEDKNFAIRCADGAFLSCAGGYDPGAPTIRYGFSLSPVESNDPKAPKYTIYFLAGKTPQDFELLYQLAPVAKGTIPKRP
jgi:hypothetical protein